MAGFMSDIMDASDDGRRSSFASCGVASGDAASVNMIAPQTARHARRSQTNGLTWTESPEINAFINADSANETASSVTGESFVADSLSIAMHRQDIAANELAQIAKMNVTPNVADEGKACCASTQDRTSAGSTRAIMRGFRTSLLCEIKRTVALTASAMILRSRAIREAKSPDRTSEERAKGMTTLASPIQDQQKARMMIGTMHATGIRLRKVMDVPVASPSIMSTPYCR